eukprot:2692825-Rhodomonas_salina.1
MCSGIRSLTTRQRVAHTATPETCSITCYLTTGHRARHTETPHTGSRRCFLPTGTACLPRSMRKTRVSVQLVPKIWSLALIWDVPGSVQTAPTSVARAGRWEPVRERQ